MTTPYPARSGAVLVRTGTPPTPPAERYVDVRPGTCTTFDGDRFRRMLSVAVVDGDRRSPVHREYREAVATVTDHLDGDDVDLVRFGSRAKLRANWPAAAVRGVEWQLATAVRRSDGLLVTWTDADSWSADRELYDAVVG